MELLALAQGKTGNGVVGFEIFPHFGMEIVERHTELRNPLSSYFPWYVIVEIAGGAAPGDLTPVLTSILEEAFEADLISDAASGQLRSAISDVLVHARAYVGSSEI